MWMDGLVFWQLQEQELEVDNKDDEDEDDNNEDSNDDDPPILSYEAANAEFLANKVCTVIVNAKSSPCDNKYAKILDSVSTYLLLGRLIGEFLAALSFFFFIIINNFLV